MTTQKGTENTVKHSDNTSSERKCEIDATPFLIIRHFVGDGDLDTIMTQIAVNRADRETGGCR